MNWNTLNIIISLSGLIIIIISVVELLLSRPNKTSRYFLWFIITSNLVIIQLMLIDIKLTEKYPVLLLFFIPFQFLSPVLFTAFTYSYLNRIKVFKRYQYFLLVPFIAFFLIYVFLKVNVFMDNALISQEKALLVSNVWDENMAVLFSLGLGIWNYKLIRNYENSLGNLPYQIVIKKTKWLKGIYTALIILCLLWVAVILFIKVNENIGGHKPYYPLWLLFIAFYYAFFFLGKKHLEQKEKKMEIEKNALTKVITDFQIEGLNKVFTFDELQAIEGGQYEMTAILSYFATSLFDQQKEEEVLNDISRNCIAKLDLEHCAIYTLDKARDVLLQKTMFTKNNDEKKISDPREVNVGENVIGKVALTAEWELISDISKDDRFSLENPKPMSELAVPIIFNKEILGVLNSKHSQINFFSERHLLFMQLIAKLMAKKLNHILKKNNVSITNDNAYYKELCYLLKNEKIYKDAGLNLTSTSKKLNISRSYLSQLVNKLSDSNFSDFINGFRIEEAKSMLLDSEFSEYTMLAIGLEAGFNSKSTFYNAFKKHTGISPTDFREKSPF